MSNRTKRHFGERFQLLLAVVFMAAFLVVFGCGGGGSGGSSGGTAATNTAPTADDGTVTTDEDQATAGSLSASDADGDPLTYSIVTNGSKGTATITDAGTGSFTYTPDANENGADTFTFKVNDGTEDSNTATVSVTINPVNDPPTANAGNPQTVDEQSTVNLAGSGNDIDGDPLTFSWTQAAGPTVNLIDADTATPSFLAPAVSTATDLTFELTVTDSGALSDSSQVVVTVNSASNLSGSATLPPGLVDLTAEGVTDWSHWGFVDATPGNRLTSKDAVNIIGDYLDLGGGLTPVSNRYTDNATAFSWSDGNPTAAELGTRTGLFFVTSAGQGFGLSVPADTTEQTLRVYVGVFSGTANFHAELDDGSGLTYDVSLANPNEIPIIRVITLNFGAAAASNLNIQFTLDTDTGDPGANVTLQAATLAPATVVTPTISPEQGVFADSVDVTIASVPPNATIRYTTDGSAPTSTSTEYTVPFTLTNTATVRAKGFLAGYNDSAEATAVFTNNPSSGNSKLSSLVETRSDLVDLTAEGVTDWSHWGFVDATPGNRLTSKDAVNIIGDYLDLGGGLTPVSFRFTDNATAFSWSDGNPTASEPSTRTGLFFSVSAGRGFGLSVPADTTEQTLRVYVGVFSGTAKFHAELDDGSGLTADVFLDNPNQAPIIRVITLNFGAAAASNLNIQFTLDTDTGDPGANVTLQAATLAP